MNTVGSWNLYRDLKSLDQVPERLEQVTVAFFGLSGLSALIREGFSPNQLKGGGILAAILAVHAVEQATGALTTAAIRLAGRGQPLAKYRGVIIRSSPLVKPRVSPAERLAGRTLLSAKGYYFHEGGRTWHAQSRTFLVNGAPRTLTRVSSLSLPYREHFFDRPLVLNEAEASQVGIDGETRSVYVQRIIDVIKGDEAPAAIPGYIGSTNELENIMTPLGDLKRALFTANWFLVDESERDDPAANQDFIDYDALVRPDSPAKQPGYYQVGQRPAWPPVSTSRTYGRPIHITPAAKPANPYHNLVSPAGASPPPPPPVRTASGSVTGSQPQPAPVPVRRTGPSNPSSSEPVQTARTIPVPGLTQAAAGKGQQPRPDNIQNRWRAPDGQDYPILIETVITHPVTKVRKAKNAFYHDGQGWRQIVDEQALVKLAEAYDRGEQTTIDEGGVL